MPIDMKRLERERRLEKIRGKSRPGPKIPAKAKPAKQQWNGPAHKTGEDVTLYHGTTKEGAAAILREGFFSGRVYLTPRSDTAADYAPVVLAVDVNPENLWMDFDTAELEEDDETIAEWLDRGESVYTRRSHVVEARAWKS